VRLTSIRSPVSRLHPLGHNKDLYSPVLGIALVARFIGLNRSEFAKAAHTQTLGTDAIASHDIEHGNGPMSG